MSRTSHVKNLRLAFSPSKPTRAKNLSLVPGQVGPRAHLDWTCAPATPFTNDHASCVARNPIYFEGTDPRNPGVPSSPPVVGTPREQFEAGLTVAEWHGYMDVIGQHNM